VTTGDRHVKFGEGRAKTATTGDRHVKLYVKVEHKQ
jgi:hypothetical protein